MDFITIFRCSTAAAAEDLSDEDLPETLPDPIMDSSSSSDPDDLAAYPFSNGR